MAEDCGVDLVVIHPRVRSQKFSGEADWGLIRMVKERTGLTIIGNGDVRSPADAARMLKETGCDGVMIGRGSWGNPWIFKRVRGLIHEGQDIPLPSWEEREQLILRHLELHLERKSAPWGLLTFIKHVGWYLKGYPCGRCLSQEDKHHQVQEAFVREIEAYFHHRGAPREDELPIIDANGMRGMWSWAAKRQQGDSSSSSTGPVATNLWRNQVALLQKNVQLLYHGASGAWSSAGPGFRRSGATPSGSKAPWTS
jgi:hypothetical protein